MKKSSQVDDGCVLYLSNRKKSATVWTDFSKGGNNGTVNGATVERQGYSFDGLTSYIDCGNKASLNIATAISIISWVNFTPTGTSPLRVVSKNIDANNRAYDFGVYPTNNRIYFGVDATAATYGVSLGSITSLKWQHIAVSYQNPNVTFYINGISDSTSNIGILATQTANAIIGTFNGLPRFWQNAIGEVRIYNRALSASEILNHYGKTRKFYGV